MRMMCMIIFSHTREYKITMPNIYVLCLIHYLPPVFLLTILIDVSYIAQAIRISFV